MTAYREFSRPSLITGWPKRYRAEVLTTYKVRIERYDPGRGWVGHWTWELGRGFGERPSNKLVFEMQLDFGLECARALIEHLDQS